MLKHRILCFIIIAFFSARTIAVSIGLDTSTQLVLGTTNAFDTPLYQRAKRILTSSFAELGYTLTIKTLPNKRSLSWANAGLMVIYLELVI
ncbi:MAG: hypothetical protein HRT52_12940 [Colwellia sp.]|nr:hypothetical protein [Colwellia sp.]